MHRIIAILLCLTLSALTLASCQKKETESTDAPPAGTVAVTTAPTAAPTAAPTHAPTQPPTAAPTEEPPRSDPKWFDDAVFIGDSITEALNRSCAADATLLGKAKFVCAQSLGFHNALSALNAPNAVHPSFEGKTILTETAGKVTGASKVFIMLGMNDVGYEPDDTIEKAKELTDRILKNSPHITLYFQSVTPIIAAKETAEFNITKVSDFNTKLKSFCEDKGYHYIDIYHRVSDIHGRLKPEYCGDPEAQGIHFNTEGCKAWANALKEAIADPFADNEPDVINFNMNPTTPPAEPTASEEGEAYHDEGVITDDIAED